MTLSVNDQFETMYNLQLFTDVIYFQFKVKLTCIIKDTTSFTKWKKDENHFNYTHNLMIKNLIIDQLRQIYFIEDQ